jgi:hypothetical protein
MASEDLFAGYPLRKMVQKPSQFKNHEMKDLSRKGYRNMVQDIHFERRKESWQKK